MADMGRSDTETYLDLVQAGSAGFLELAELLHSITDQQAQLFCDPSLVDFIEPFLADRIKSLNKRMGSLDLWSAGCGAGAEAWTLAIMAKTVLFQQRARHHYSVVGTDISSAALQDARRGIFLESDLSHVPMNYRVNCLTAIDPVHFRIAEDLAERACFIQSNLVTSEELLGIDMDLIVCRDVLPYYHRKSKHKILDCLVDHLKPGGLLVVGQGESEGWSHAGVSKASTGNLDACFRQ